MATSRTTGCQRQLPSKCVQTCWELNKRHSFWWEEECCGLQSCEETECCNLQLFYGWFMFAKQVYLNFKHVCQTVCVYSHWYSLEALCWIWWITGDLVTLVSVLQRRSRATALIEKYLRLAATTAFCSQQRNVNSTESGQFEWKAHLPHRQPSAAPCWEGATFTAHLCLLLLTRSV